MHTRYIRVTLRDEDVEGSERALRLAIQKIGVGGRLVSEITIDPPECPSVSVVDNPKCDIDQKGCDLDLGHPDQSTHWSRVWGVWYSDGED